MKVILDEIARFSPKTGFNVVGEDDFELPGERLFLLGHFATKEEAEAAAQEHREDMALSGNDMDKVHVYAPWSD